MIPYDQPDMGRVDHSIVALLEEYRARRPKPLLRIFPAGPCRAGRKTSCQLAALYRLPGGLLLVGERQVITAADVDRVQRRRQPLVAILSDQGWINLHGHGHVDLACAHRDFGLLDAERVRALERDVATGRSKRGVSLLIDIV